MTDSPRMAHLVGLAEELVPFLEKRGDLFFARPDIEMTETNYQKVLRIKKDLLAADTEGFAEGFLQNQAGIACQHVVSAFETHKQMQGLLA